MVSPIIASLGAATLLLASWCFTSITAADDNDDAGSGGIQSRIQPDTTDDTISSRIQSGGMEDIINMRMQPPDDSVLSRMAPDVTDDAISMRLQPDGTDDDAGQPDVTDDTINSRIQSDDTDDTIGMRMQQLPPPPRNAKGYVRKADYAAPRSYWSSGSRSFNGGGRPSGDQKKRKESSKVTDGKLENATKRMMDEYLSVLGRQFLLILEIAAKEIDRGVKRVAANVENHEDGEINYEAKTKMAKAVGIKAQAYLKQFFRDRWVGVLAHIAQEATDRFLAGSKTFFDKTDMKKLLA